ncbi:MAG: hypothetical protein JXM69_07730 [Anaerolineae bacterium]|nr:hypothetical protein [Anaerolineae bacterium]
MDDKPDAVELTSPEQAESPPELPVDVLPPAEHGSPTVTFRGNGYDLAAVIGVTIGGMVLLSCVTCNLAYYAFPFIPIILGIVGLVLAKDSVEPERTKLLSWLSLGSGAIFLLLAFLCVLIYLGFIIFAVAVDSGGFN